MKALVLILITLSFSLAYAKPKTAPTKQLDEAGILAEYDIFKLDQAGTLMMAAIDAPKPLKTTCYIEGSRAVKLSETLHSLIDTQTDAYVKDRQAKNKTMSDGTWDSRCSAVCSCGAETSILEKVGYAKLAKVDQKAYDVVSKLAAKQSPADIKACLAKTQWICKSDLLKYVRKTAGRGGAY